MLVDIGESRGRLEEPAAASLARIDAQLGRPLDINEAWRSPEQADKNHAAYLAYVAYQRGGPPAPWAPIALPASQSVHCVGEAIDTDDHALVAVLNDHGWFQTVYRGGQLVEPWHFEYSLDRDNHRNDPARSTITQEDPMALRIITGPYYRSAGSQVLHNGIVARAIPNDVALALRQGGIPSKDYDRDDQFDTELREVWEMAKLTNQVAATAMVDEFGKRLAV